MANKTPIGKRSMINIELTAEAQKAVDDVCDQEGMKKRELVARVLRWFASQPEETRAMVLGQIPQNLVPMVAKNMLEELAKGESRYDRLVGHVEAGESRRSTRGAGAKAVHA